MHAPTDVQDVSIGLAVLNNLLLAGFDSSGSSILTTLDTSTGTDTTLLDSSNEIELYHLDFAASQNRVLFDGLRFSDNNYVVGYIDLATRKVVVSAVGNNKLIDLKAF